MELASHVEIMEQEGEIHSAALNRARADSDDLRSGQLQESYGTLGGQLARLKPWTAAALGALFLIVVLMGLWHWQLMLVVLALLLPTLGQLVRWWQRDPSRCPLDHVLASYVSGLFVQSVTAMGTASVAAVLTGSLVLGPILGALHFFDVWQLGTLVFIFGMWGTFCFIEDLWLVNALRAARRRRAHHHAGAAQRREASVVYATASAVGYATAQCVALTCIVTAIMEGHTAFELHEEKAKDGEITANEAGFLFVLTLVFSWYWLPVRLLASHLEALEIELSPNTGGDDDANLSGCDNLCPLRAAKADGLAPDSDAAGSGCCCERFLGLVHVIKWPWALRTTHFTFFLYWFLILVDVHLFLWLAVAFLTWCAVMVVAVKRIKHLESTMDPNAAAATGLRELYGFSLLDNEGDDAPVAPAASDAAVV
mmetsp:Transcript_14000/g.48165  ORF Transcript_14000/g.48165 Transcript_14000/m.48165 type:complete len:425 (-) Transcript_14000:43-1317(-)